MKKVMVTLTAYNEAKNLGHVVGRITAQGYGCILVDDGSRDDTARIAEEMGAKVLRHVTNLGQGWSVLTSFKAALYEDCDYIVEMDADGQHDPDEINNLIEELDRSGADIVVGSRILGDNHPNAPFFRKTFLPHFTALINRLTGYQMTDALCGFRAFTKGAMQKASPAFEDMLEPQYIAAEMFIRFSELGLTVSETPIHLQDRASGKSYKGFVRYGWGILKAIVQTLRDTRMNGGRR